MSRYLFIESRDAFESLDAPRFLDLVAGVRARRHDTTLYLVQNAVLAAREGCVAGERLTALSRAGVRVLADAFSLRERAIERPVAGVTASDIDAVVGALLDPQTRAIWH